MLVLGGGVGIPAADEEPAGTVQLSAHRRHLRQPGGTLPLPEALPGRSGTLTQLGLSPGQCRRRLLHQTRKSSIQLHSFNLIHST